MIDGIRGGGSLQGFSEVIFSQLCRKSWSSSHSLVHSPTRCATSQTSVRYLLVTTNETRIHLQQLQNSRYFDVSMHSLKETREDLLNSSVWRGPYIQKNGKRRSRRHSRVLCHCYFSWSSHSWDSARDCGTGDGYSTSDLYRNFIQGEVNLPSGTYFKNSLGLYVQAT